MLPWRLYRYSLPLRWPLPGKARANHRRTGWVVAIADGEGRWGFGEIAPLSGVHVETVESVREEILRRLRCWSVALLVEGWHDPGPPVVAFGLEMARDALRTPPRTVTVPLNALLRGTEPLPGYRAHKMKVGRLPVGLEIERVRESAASLPPGALLRLDANQSWTLDEARRFCGGVAGLPIDYLEEPLRDPTRLAKLDAPFDIALDDTLWHASDPVGVSAVDVSAVDVLVLKPSVVDAARRSRLGKRVVISSVFETGLGLSRLAALAAEITPDEPAGLDTWRWLARDLVDPPVRAQGGSLTVGRPVPLRDRLVADACWERPAQISVPAIGADPLADHPDAAFLITDERTWTRAEWRSEVVALAGRLRAAGVAPGDTVGLWGWRQPGYLAALFALWWLRCTARPLHERSPVAVDGTLLAFGPGAPPAERCLTMDSLPDAIGPVPGPDLDAPATHLSTSGSTGAPKQVVATLRQHLESARASQANLPLRPGDRWLLSLPLYHVGGVAIVARTVLAGAAVVRSDLPPDGALRRVTHLSVVPTQLRRLLSTAEGRAAARRLSAILLGGARPPPALVARARGLGLPIHATYGCTEAGSQISTTPHDATQEDLSTAGWPLEHVEVRVADDDRLWVRGTSVIGDSSLGGEGGWLRTGDAGRFDDDGRLVVLGRADEVIISGGENIHPAEIERALLAAPGVRDARVVGVPDDDYGERPVAFVLGDPDPVALHATLDARLPRFKHPVLTLPWPEVTGLKPVRRDLIVRACQALEG